MAARFKFYEVVTIVSDCSDFPEVNGLEGAVLGMSEDDDGSWGYSVFVLSQGECLSFAEDELVSTGRMMAREDFYTGEVVTVVVDPVTGEGSLKE